MPKHMKEWRKGKGEDFSPAPIAATSVHSCILYAKR